ncbi:hypothetical protein BDN72DRAFT_904880 [Pluteus cervinus]|uniref:Uncharacterized protein n=1 Tax=Pluteus cervinus TaxID=181527 RepID=A0ACD3A6S6_9AGAR|nr:hypothetical protein BDN72DRAFT_904880 [Pluteus cervinus]
MRASTNRASTLKAPTPPPPIRRSPRLKSKATSTTTASRAKAISPKAANKANKKANDANKISNVNSDLPSVNHLVNDFPNIGLLEDESVKDHDHGFICSTLLLLLPRAVMFLLSADTYERASGTICPRERQEIEEIRYMLADTRVPACGPDDAEFFVKWDDDDEFATNRAERKVARIDDVQASLENEECQASSSLHLPRDYMDHDGKPRKAKVKKIQEASKTLKHTKLRQAELEVKWD